MPWTHSSVIYLFIQLTHRYLKDASFSLEPRITLKWLENTNFLMKILMLPSVDLSIINPSIQAEQWIVLGAVFPPNFSRTTLMQVTEFFWNFIYNSKGLQHESNLVKYTTLKLLLVIFQKFGAVSQSLQTLEQNLSQASEWELLRSELFDTMKREVPGT